MYSTAMTKNTYRIHKSSRRGGDDDDSSTEPVGKLESSQEFVESSNEWEKTHMTHVKEEDLQDLSSISASTISAPIPATRLRPTTSDGSSRAPAPPVLRRSRYLQAATYPGAVAIVPASSALVNSDGDEDTVDNQDETNQRQRDSTSDGSYLVNARLVVDSNEEDNDVEEQRRSDARSTPLANATPRPPVVTAKLVMDDKASQHQPKEMGFKDFFGNRMVRVVGLFVCVIIAGLIVGIIIGFGSSSKNSAVLEAANIPAATDAPETTFAPNDPSVDTPSPTPAPVNVSRPWPASAPVQAPMQSPSSNTLDGPTQYTEGDYAEDDDHAQEEHDR